MKISRSKTAATMIALFLVLTIAATLVALPIANAHYPAWSVPTFSYISIAPDLVGVDQKVNVVFWVDKVPPTAAGSGGDRWTFYVDITKPDGSKEPLGPFTSDPVGGGWTAYIPDQVGTYTFVSRFPGQVVTGSAGTGIYNYNIAINNTYLASSATTTLTVQQEPIPAPITSYPLPTEYWTRPIEGQNIDWWKIASNWLAGSHIVQRFQPDGIAPNSAHIMWSKPLEFGGVVGGSNLAIEGDTFYEGCAYEQKFTGTIIMNGRLYYNLPRSDSPTGNGYVCVDLLTGETIFWQNMTKPSFGQLYDYQSMNQHGVIPNGYLWATTTAAGVTTWMAFDPLDGNWLFNETNVPSGTTVYGPNGEILIYQLDATRKWLALWNNTAAQALTGATNPTDTTSSSFYQWRPVGKTVNASNAYSWNVTIPSLMTGATIVKVVQDDILLGRNGSLPSVSVQTPYTMWAISLKPATRGNLLWMKTYDPPPGNITVVMGPVCAETRVFAMAYKETIKWVGYSLDDGSLLWGPTPSQTDFEYHKFSESLGWALAYGKLYNAAYGGILYCYDMKNGSLLWTYGNGGPGNSTNSGFQAPYGRYPIFPGFVADGKIYLYTTEHSPNSPLIKGARMRCVDAYTGKEIWTLMGYSGDANFVVADGFLVYLNHYNMQIYCVGKGPSATTVEAPMTAITAGNSVVIQGTVTDIAAGTKQNEQAARFPNGVPAVSDASQSAWMEYVYMQKPIPTNAVGVEVTLDAIDPNNNFIHIGTVTSDTSSLFSYAWTTPDVPGKYTVIATFAGSASYYSSYAETAIGISEAPLSPAAPEPAAAQPPLDLYIIGTGIAMIIAIAIATILILRKKP